MMNGRLLFLVLAALAALSRAAPTASTAPSICVSAADCCSFSSAAQRALPCCGSSLSGPEALRCGDDGRCYRGVAPCKSSVDDPLCNIPHAAVGDATTTLDEALDQWRQCRRGSHKMHALRQLDLYGGGGVSLVIEAASDARGDSVEWLLEQSASASDAVNARGYAGATALHAAAAASVDHTAEATATLQLLLANGADPNAIDAFGFTPLHRVIQANNVEGATLLLSSGANLTIEAPGRETPLHLAAYENSRELAQLLLAFGADPFARNDRGVTSFEVGLFDLSVPPHHMA